MTLVAVPVRYPLTRHSRATLAEAISIADKNAADLIVLHIDLYHNSGQVTRSMLKDEVESEFGVLSDTRYTVRRGLLVEESILEEIAAEDADIVVVGKKQVSRWRAMVKRLVDNPNIEQYLRDELDCQVVTAVTDSA
jgi:nucleotide-binding universal stress UspA family protein